MECACIQVMRNIPCLANPLQQILYWWLRLQVPTPFSGNPGPLGTYGLHCWPAGQFGLGTPSASVLGGLASAPNKSAVPSKYNQIFFTAGTPFDRSGLSPKVTM